MGQPRRRETEYTQEEKEESALTLPSVIQEAASPLMEMFTNRSPGQRLTDIEEDALVKLLAVTGGNISQVSRMTGVSKGEVFNVKHANQAAFLEVRERFKRAMTMEAQDVAIDAAAVVRARIGEASARDAAVVFGIFTEKAAQLAGEGSTVTHLVKHQVDQASLDALTERLRAIHAPTNEVIGDADFTIRDDD